MSTIFIDKLIDFIINILSIILGGGLVVMLIEWRRHRREKDLWAREDAMIQIDIPRAEVFTTKWQIRDDMEDNEKINIYENQLDGTINRLMLVVEFVIRNTTAAELIVTSYEVNILQLPSAASSDSYFELDTFDLISKEDIGAIRLKPFGTIPRCYLYTGRFGKTGKLENPPATVSVEARLSNGKVIQGKSTVNVVPKVPNDIELHESVWLPKKYVDKVRIPEPEVDDIPF